MPKPGLPTNGLRKAIASVLAAVTLTVLVYAALLALTQHEGCDLDRAALLAVFLGLHTFALHVLLGADPWAHIRASRRNTPHGESPDE